MIIHQFKTICFTDRPTGSILQSVVGFDHTEIMLGRIDVKNWSTFLAVDSVKQEGKWQKRA